MSSHSSPWRPAGFTLIELLVVISIISLLIAMLLPSLANARKVAQQAMCASNVRQIALSSHGYAADNRGYIGYIDQVAHGNDRIRTFTIWAGGKPLHMGQWIHGGYITGRLMFCPGPVWTGNAWTADRVAVGGPNRINIENWSAGNLVGGGIANYAMNGGLLSAFGPAGAPWRQTVEGVFYKIDDIPSTWPVMSDLRAPSGTWHSLTVSNHDSRGFNVAFGDGSAEFMRAPGEINPNLDDPGHPYNKSTGLHYSLRFRDFYQIRMGILGSLP